MNIDELIHNLSGLIICAIMVAMTIGGVICGVVCVVRLMKGDNHE